MELAFFLYNFAFHEKSCAYFQNCGETMLDDTDRRILRQYQADPETPMADLAERAGVTASTLARRLGAMRDGGVLRGVRGVIDWGVLGYSIEVMLRVTLDKTEPRAFDEFLAGARKVPEVTEIQTFLGTVDVRLVVIARDLQHYQALYRERLLVLPHIADIEALMHVSLVKSDETVPL
ncbi:Lrp/AsnC family transcriptional regulator [Salipiger aestuarii]|uniref:Lrp/AsnC family transcriptional regulator n=2 Tax=Salipiger aestuarii TaxID=568098 RepID=A0A327Y8M2_9RHOB|nr:Lrp/AsnC family transcriptional regulator [Salipiger aestuarii]